MERFIVQIDLYLSQEPYRSHKTNSYNKVDAAKYIETLQCLNCAVHIDTFIHSKCIYISRYIPSVWIYILYLSTSGALTSKLRTWLNGVCDESEYAVDVMGYLRCSSDGTQTPDPRGDAELKQAFRLW